jgi:hypothetical protein
LLPIPLLCALPAAAQQWTADVYAGGTRYDALASFVGAANLVGNVRVESSRLFAYLSAAAPLDSDAPLWSALGGGMRLRRGLTHGGRIGLDIGADAYAFRHTAAATGKGATTHVLPLVGLTRGIVDVQLRGGRRDHHADRPGGTSSRHMYEAGARGTLGGATHVAVADLRVLTASGASYPMAQLQVGTTFHDARFWGLAGRWFGDDLRETVWGAGGSVQIGLRGELWASGRHDAEPLYLTLPRTSWNIGYSMKLGHVERVTPAPVLRDGMIVVRLLRSADADAAPAVAGEFSDWQPLPMRASGDEWVIEIPARPGVYRFAFVAPTGEWFVPEGYPGRMDDDMGGHVAVVVVQ